MSEFNLTEQWSEERIENRISELHDQVAEISKEMSKIDNEINELRKRKEKLADQMGHNMRYKNAMVNDLFNRKGNQTKHSHA